MSGRPVPIVDNYAAIAQRLRELERKPFALPSGIVVLLSSEITPSVRMPPGADTVFLLHMSSVKSRLSVIHMRDPEVVAEKLEQLTEAIARVCPSAQRDRAEIILSGEDALRLVELLRRATGQ
jgi:hypothetical protein